MGTIPLTEDHFVANYGWPDRPIGVEDFPMTYFMIFSIAHIMLKKYNRPFIDLFGFIFQLIHPRRLKIDHKCLYNNIMKRFVCVDQRHKGRKKWFCGEDVKDLPFFTNDDFEPEEGVEAMVVDDDERPPLHQDAQPMN